MTTSNKCLTLPRGTYYFGHVKTTVSGRTCMRYDLQSPHSHGYAFAKDHEIYCRNPFMGIPSEKVKDSGVLPLIPTRLGNVALFSAW